jgi:hypothetical protein
MMMNCNLSLWFQRLQQKKTKTTSATCRPSFGCNYNVKETTTTNKHLLWWFLMLQHIKKAKMIRHPGFESTHNEKKPG